MGISSRFTVGVHMLTLLAIDRNSRCTSEWIAGSVNTNPVVIRRITGMLKEQDLLMYKLVKVVRHLLVI